MKLMVYRTAGTDMSSHRVVALLLPTEHPLAHLSAQAPLEVQEVLDGPVEVVAALTVSLNNTNLPALYHRPMVLEPPAQTGEEYKVQRATPQPRSPLGWAWEDATPWQPRSEMAGVESGGYVRVVVRDEQGVQWVGPMFYRPKGGWAFDPARDWPASFTLLEE